jgi:hypothetical protein
MCMCILAEQVLHMLGVWWVLRKKLDLINHFLKNKMLVLVS